MTSLDIAAGMNSSTHIEKNNNIEMVFENVVQNVWKYSSYLDSWSKS